MTIEMSYIDYAGVKLWVPTFLVDLWPKDLPPEKWPTFCGAGDGMGDKLVPDTIHGVPVSPACFIHDIMWILVENTKKGFRFANKVFRKNLNALVRASLSKTRALLAQVRCFGYWFAVATVGLKHFKADPQDRMVCADPFQHPAIRDKLHRLSRVAHKIPGYDSNGGPIF